MSASSALRSLSRVSLASSRRAPVLGFRNIHASSRLSEQYANANLETFNKVVGAKDRLVLVDFYADWCGPCHQLAPILEKIATDGSVKSRTGLPIDVVKIDVDNDEVNSIAAQHGVRALPTVIAFLDGQPVDQFVGALPEAGVKRFLEKV
ncbi:hypothetical protein H0H92_005496 [Tricholoma furcatifolium]|nr:hypothetical protein H0H92_005496 [Tricholoma furcatifolium]